MSPRRMILIPWLIWAIVLGAAIGGAFYASGAHAETPTFSSVDENGRLTLTEAACEKAGPWFAKWRAATWLYQGKHYDACWTMARASTGAEIVLVIDSDGQVSNIDARHFRRDMPI
jgi:hypothetical protein